MVVALALRQKDNRVDFSHHCAKTNSIMTIVINVGVVFIYGPVMDRQTFSPSSSCDP